jgi:hypothetical protein
VLTLLALRCRTRLSEADGPAPETLRKRRPGLAGGFELPVPPGEPRIGRGTSPGGSGDGPQTERQTARPYVRRGRVRELSRSTLFGTRPRVHKNPRFELEVLA